MFIVDEILYSAFGTDSNKMWQTREKLKQIFSHPLPNNANELAQVLKDILTIALSDLREIERMP